MKNSSESAITAQISRRIAEEKIEKMNNLFKIRVFESKDIYIQKMNNEFKDKPMFSTQELNELNEKHRIEAILHFKGIENTVITGFDGNSYLSSLEQSIDEEFDRFVDKNQSNRDFIEKDLEVITNQFLEKYESELEEYNETVDSHHQLDVIDVVTNDIETQFKAKNPFSELSSFEPYLQKFQQKMSKCVQNLILRLNNQEFIVKILTINVQKYYKEEMEKYFQKTSFLSKEQLMKNNETVLKNSIKKFESQRVNMSFDNYKKLITDSVKHIFAQIVAENDMNTPTIPAIGIHLGTTNSCVAYFKPDSKKAYNVVVIYNELIKKRTSSVVSIRDQSVVIVGDVAKDEINVYPNNTIYSINRLIGRQFTDQLIQNMITSEPKLSYKVIDDGFNKPKISLIVNGNEETYSAEQISSHILKKMKEIAEKHLGFQVKRAVITVPVHFNEAQKEATKDAGILAGLEVMKIIDESTAAAMAFRLYTMKSIDPRKVLVYRFGGTFDVSVLVIHKGEIVIKAVGGDNHLSAEDFTNNIVNHCLEEFRAQTGLIVSSIDGTGADAITQLKSICEKQKCCLSSTNSIDISIVNFYNNQDLSVSLSRDVFNDQNKDIFIRTMDLVTKTLEDANMTHSDIDDIVLIGGSTRIPRIQEMLSEQFGGRAINHGLNPEETVVVGAAIQAAILNGEQTQGLDTIVVTDSRFTRFMETLNEGILQNLDNCRIN